MEHTYVGRYYRGWFIGYDAFAPITGRYGANRFGVEMCANSYESILKMVDARVEENKSRGLTFYKN